jgi:L-amino acid N-acyltransferase YncA
MKSKLTSKNLLSECSFRYAASEDVDELLALYQQFFAEAVYKDFITFDSARARNTIEGGLLTQRRPHLVAIVEGRIVGFIAWQLDHSFSVKPVQVLYEAYVEPEHRLSAIGRYLVELAVKEGRHQGACVFHAPVASGMAAAKSLKNLLAKCGFAEFGYIMRKGLA